jgi:tetratricopeptide (TPR) repeat protein
VTTLTADEPRPDGSSAPPPAPPAASPVPPRAGFGRRVLRFLLAPLRYALRRPLRAAGYLALFLLVASALAVGGAWFWFDHHLRTARAELDRGHNAVALRHLEKCRLLRSDHREVLILSARVARRSGSWDEAEFFLERYSTLHGESDESVLERLLLRAARGEIEETAPALLARIRAGGPDANLCREALVTGLLYRYYWGAAARYLDEWLAEVPDSTTALLLRGKLEEQRLATTPALEIYRRVVALDPYHDEARLRLATLLLTNRFGEEALEHLTPLRQRLPGHPEVALLWARALALQGRNAESRSALAECLREHPDYPAALAERASQALTDGNEPEAERLLARSVALDPGNVITRGQYAFVLARNGKRAEAAQEQARVDALKIDLDRITVLFSGPLQERPNDPQVPHEIAQIALRSGQIREAIRWFTAALRVDPNHVPTHLALARLYRDLDNPVMASRHRAQARGAGPEPAPAKP